QGHDDVLLGIDRVLQLGEHRGGGGGDQLVVVQAIAGDDVVLGGVGEAGAGLDAVDLAAEAVGLTLEVHDRLDVVHVVGDGEVQLRPVVVAEQVLDVVAVLLHVLGVGDLGPGGGVDVHIALGQARVQQRGIGDGLVLDGVPHRGQPVVEQVGGGQTVGPGGDVAQGDGLALGAVTAAAAAAAVPAVAAAGGEAEAHQAGATAHQGGAAGDRVRGPERVSRGHDQSSFPGECVGCGGQAGVADRRRLSRATSEVL